MSTSDGFPLSDDDVETLIRAAMPSIPLTPEPSYDLGDLLAEIVASQRPRRRRFRWLRLHWPLAGALLLLAGTGATLSWAAIRNERATNPTRITCFRNVSLSADRLEIEDTTGDVANECRAAWHSLSPQWGAPPVMVACVMSGVAAVFPAGSPVPTVGPYASDTATESAAGGAGLPDGSTGNTTTCSGLGLADLVLGRTPGEVKVAEFVAAVTGEVGMVACRPPADVVLIARRTLIRFSLPWMVVQQGVFDASQPCGSLDIDVEHLTVFVDPLPDLSQPTGDAS